MVDVGGVAQVYGGTFPAHSWHDLMSNALASQPAAYFTPPNYALLPAPHYITSPSLVAADVLNHNTVAGCSTTNPYSSYNSNSYTNPCGTGQTGTPTTNGNGSRYRYQYSPPTTGYRYRYSPPATYAPRYTPPPTQPPATAPPATRAPTPTTPPKKSHHP
jgi:hypothetical protein